MCVFLFLQEARIAVEQIVIPKGQPAELLPRSLEVIALQVKLVEGYQLATEKVGAEVNIRLRILPTQLNVKTSDPVYNEEAESEFEEDEEFDSDVEDLGISIAGGTSPGRLPILPEWSMASRYFMYIHLNTYWNKQENYCSQINTTGSDVLSQVQLENFLLLKKTWLRKHGDRGTHRTSNLNEFQFDGFFYFAVRHILELHFEILECIHV